MDASSLASCQGDEGGTFHPAESATLFNSGMYYSRFPLYNCGFRELVVTVSKINILQRTSVGGLSGWELHPWLVGR